MLKEVLKEIEKGKYISKSNIAKNLNTTESIVEEAFEHLIRMGYIERDSGKDCNFKCNGCSFASLCNKIPISTISITDKGKKLLINTDVM